MKDAFREQLQQRREQLQKELDAIDTLLAVREGAGRGRGRKKPATGDYSSQAIGQFNRRLKAAQEAGDKAKVAEYKQKLREAGVKVPRAKQTTRPMKARRAKAKAASAVEGATA